MDNLLMVHYTDSVEIAEEFDELPYDNKIIFTTFDSGIKSAYNLKGNRDISFADFTTTVNRVAQGERSDIDLLKLLIHRKDFLRIC